MNDLSSLIQGKQFNKKMYSIKRRMYEGFKNKSNDLDDFNKLQSEFNILMTQYNELQQQIQDNTMSSINRVSYNNPYLNKYLLFTDGTIVYVTNQGIAKPFTSEDIFNSVIGKNGCPPKDFIKLNIPWSSDYIVGAKIPTNPSLIVGSPMVSAQSCGNEGNNVYASKMINNPTSSYVGCYNNNNQQIIDELGYTTFDNCENYAVNNGYKYFGLQNYQADGTAQCMISNDLTNITKNEDASFLATPIPLWSSNTASGEQNIVQLQGTGQLVIQKTDGTIISEINSATTECTNWGTILIDSATFGGNCGNSIGNITNKVTSCNYKSNCNIPISSANFEQSFSSECSKAFDIVYKCGGSLPITKNLANAEGQTMILDCNDYMQTTCQFYLLLEDNGNMSIYKGKDTSDNQGLVWSSSTSDTYKDKNPEWIASKGKYGRNYLKTGETLAMNEWIGSSNGSIKLVMQQDGNLVLYTSEINNGCKKFNNKLLGGENINAVYKLNETGNISNLGKVGYVDSDSILKEYPNSMLGFSNNYQIYKNTDSPGNDISSSLVKDQSECEHSCNNNLECAGYVYQDNTKTCWLKKRSNFVKESNNNVLLGVRNPKLKGSTTCNNKIVDVDTIQYSNYIKGNQMTPDTQCNKSIMSQEDRVKFDTIRSRLASVSKDIAKKMTQLQDKDNKIYEKMNMNAQQFKKDLEKYNAINAKIQNELDINVKEGMENMNDLQGMLTDSDLIVLQENYNYILWSILAVGVLTITVNTMNK
jgi:hypothetical protein